MNRHPRHTDDALFDARLRTLVHTAVASAPPVPEIETTTVLPLRREPSPARRTVLRVAVAGAAAALLGGALIASRPTDEHVEPQDSVPPAATPADTGLAVHVAPTAVPSGWQLVDISERRWAMPPNVFADRSQLLRRNRDGAALMFEWQDSGVDAAATAGTPIVAPTEVAATEVAVPAEPKPSDTGEAVSSGYGTMTIDDGTVVITAIGMTDAEANSLVAQLAPTGDDPEWLGLPVEAGFVDERRMPSYPVSATISGEMVYLTPHGERVQLMVQNVWAPDGAQRAGVPGSSYGPVIYETAGGGQRHDIPGVVVEVFTSGDRKQALQLLASIQPVDAPNWRVAADDLARRVLQAGNQVSRHTARGFDVAVIDIDVRRYVCVIADRSTCHESFAWDGDDTTRAFSDEFRLADGWAYVSLMPAKPGQPPEAGAVELTSTPAAESSAYLGWVDGSLLAYWEFPLEVRSAEVMLNRTIDPATNERVGGGGDANAPLL